jgi:hypothetical protein
VTLVQVWRIGSPNISGGGRCSRLGSSGGWAERPGVPKEDMVDGRGARELRELREENRLAGCMSAEKLPRDGTSDEPVLRRLSLGPFPAPPTLPSALKPWALGLPSPSGRKPSEETGSVPGAAAVPREGSMRSGRSARSFKARGERLDVPEKHRDECTRIHSAMVSGGSPARIRSSTLSHRSGSLSVSARMSAFPCRCSVRSLSISDLKWSLVLHFLSS